MTTGNRAFLTHLNLLTIDFKIDFLCCQTSCPLTEIAMSGLPRFCIKDLFQLACSTSRSTALAAARRGESPRRGSAGSCMQIRITDSGVNSELVFRDPFE